MKKDANLAQRRKSVAPAKANLTQIPTHSTTTTILSLLKLLLPLLFLDTQRSSLSPLFSSSPLSSITLDLALLLSFSFLLLFLLTPLRSPILNHSSISTLLLGWSLLTSEVVVKLGAVWFQGFGAKGGVWIARGVVEGLTGWLRCATVIGAVRDLTRGGNAVVRIAFLSAIALPLAIVAAQPIFISLMWECKVLQTQGLLLVSISLISDILTPSTPSSTSNSKPIIRKPIIRQTHLTVLLWTLLLTYLTSQTSPHCLLPSSPYFSFLPSSPFTPPNSINTTILASSKGPTGVVVVGEHTLKDDQMFRYLRVDHSLIGGLWVGPSRKRVIKGMKDRGVSLWEKVNEDEVVGTAESIYSTFILQEIVRLAVPLQRVRRERALVIGLGAGLSMRALQLHGVNTTIVEIDPAVYDYARTYFGVPEPMGGVALEDARIYLERNKHEKYDFVIHDVFTGGTVPSTLFTLECWAAISRVLTPTGVVAINFAGSINAPSAHIVFATIIRSFSHCRGFEDGPPTGHYRNIVIICSNRPINFRDPVPSDYLEYPSATIRKRVLDTFREFEIDFRGTDRKTVLDDRTAGLFDDAQVDGAFEHWGLMSQVLSKEAWAMW